MSRRPFIEQPPCGATSVLLHTCCAPCSSAIIEWLKSKGLHTVIYYCNPNIHPREEYEHRRDECRRYAALTGVEMVEAPYDHDAWLSRIKGLEHERERGARCLECFKMRLEMTARYAASRQIPLIATTLASSRWKSLEQIAEAGTAAVSGSGGIAFWDQNWRRNGLTERRAELIRQHCFYNQQYCGCEFSMPPTEK